jgi:hypothetical protein
MSVTLFKKRLTMSFDVDIEVPNEILDQLPTNEEAAEAFANETVKEMGENQRVFNMVCIVEDRV